jgi:lipopolysaccharide biosynthesis regulator YciM
MPTESTFFFAGLLFLAAALGYVFARFGDLDDDEAEQEDRQASILRGFRYLLNDEPDRAVDAFTTGESIDDEAVETRLALGALFRRRGELERAIRLHESLLARPEIGADRRDRVAFALAEDYLGAGLFDRAEELYLRLLDSRGYRTAALERLLRICEVTREWARAIELGADLRRAEGGTLDSLQVGHYHCELAEAARRGGDAATARGHCREAAAEAPGLPRAALIEADLDAAGGDPAGAARAYRALLAGEPALVSEVLPRLARLGPLGGDSVAALEAAAGGTIGALRRVVAALAATDGIDLDRFAPLLERYVEAEPVLAPLLAPGDIAGVEPARRRVRLEALRRSLQAALRATPRYRCGNCGYQSAALQWQCPGCRRWDTVRASDSLLPAPPGPPAA